jgi:carboxyl-terminal processing protease
MRGFLLGIALAVMVLVSARGAAGRSPSPQLYLDHALALVTARAVVTPAKGWPSVIRQAHRIAARAKKPADTYGAIIFVLDRLYAAGDAHAYNGFTNPFQAKLEAQAATERARQIGTTPTPPPTVSLLDGRIGAIMIPAVNSPPNTPNGERYTRAALTGLASLEATAKPCGWIVDLRGNTGGNVWPMLLGLGPLLGDGKLVGFRTRAGSEPYIAYRDGLLSGVGHSFRAPINVPVLSPAPPVAVLTDAPTLSSGEAVTIAFHGRANTRSFGTPTGGVPTSPQTFRLSDGALVHFSTADDVDRTGVVYTGPIAPDQPVAADLPDNAATAAAEEWLLSMPACSAVGVHS